MKKSTKEVATQIAWSVITLLGKQRKLHELSIGKERRAGVDILILSDDQVAVEPNLSLDGVNFSDSSDDVEQTIYLLPKISQYFASQFDINHVNEYIIRITEKG